MLAGVDQSLHIAGHRSLGATSSLKLTQSRVALARGKYDDATRWAVEAYLLMKEIQSALDRRAGTDLLKFVEIYRALQQNKYASPEAEHLRWMLIRDNAISFAE